VSKLSDEIGDGEVLKIKLGNRILITMVVKNERQTKKQIFSIDC
jgi:hypothetical protein